MRIIEKMKENLELKNQKQFDKMLDMSFPRESIIELKNSNGETHYFQMCGKDIPGIAFTVEGRSANLPSKLKQLTGAEAGTMHEINPPSGYSTGLYTCEFNGFRIIAIEKRLIFNYEGLVFPKQTITMRQLLTNWKIDNNQSDDIDFEADYEMVKRVYDSEDMFSKSKTEELSK